MNELDRLLHEALRMREEVREYAVLLAKTKTQQTLQRKAG